jgi:hypothetical protein
MSDLLRFTRVGSQQEGRLLAAFQELAGVDPRETLPRANAWLSLTDHLIASDLASPPGYRALKAELFLGIEPGWGPFFADADAAIDWRMVTWGGVTIDDRPLGSHEPCAGNCIPALDDPPRTAAAEGAWCPDGMPIFGLVVGGEALALPKNLMEVHELVNLTLGGRRLGIPYCTLCASAQAYLTDAVPAEFSPLVLRTSGLLARSNKTMFDLGTRSVIDTFTGRALSGPLQDAGVVLESVTVVVSTWGDWQRAHPDTSIVARDGGIGRDYPLDPLQGRDDDGPIFAIGAVDHRLPAQEPVVGVVAADRFVAFPAQEARATLAAGERVVGSGIELIEDGGGLRARDEQGRELVAHQAFWFAWSQFHPCTVLWRAAAR